MVTIYTTVSGLRYLDNIPHFHTNDEQPKIFVACLDSYHNGKVYGLWINATQEIEAIKQQISIMLSGSHYLEPDAYPAPRMYAIHAQEGFYNLQLDVHANIEDMRAQALFIAKHGELGAKLIAHYEGTLEAAEEVINQRYQGEYKNPLEYATQLFNKLYLNTIPEHIQFCIDYEAFKKTIFHHYFFSIELSGKTHVFFEYLGDWDFKHSLDDFLKPYRCTFPIND
jgi:antirestriction protein